MGHARLPPTGPKQIQAKTFSWTTEKQRKALETDFLFERDICLICLSQTESNYSNHFENVKKFSEIWTFKGILAHLQILFHNFKALPRIKHLP